MTSIEKTIVSFHIGRGGHFHNPGHVSFIGEQPISDFVDDLFLNYENQNDFKNRFGFDDTKSNQQRSILDLINDRDFDELNEKFGITEEMLGACVYMDGGGNPVGLTEDEADTGVGAINIDNDYDTTYAQYLGECSDEELTLILQSERYVSDDVIAFAKNKLETLNLEHYRS